ncbi:Kinesin-like protein [Entamoeba marina]
MSSSPSNSFGVAIRIRPQLDAEVNDKCITCPTDNIITLSTKHDVQNFSFDYVANELTSQAEIFKQIGVPLVDTTLQGYNSTLFAYGQTGSGKTYTTFGEYGFEEKQGIVPRCLHYLFEKIRELTTEDVQFLVKCSMCEIYNEKILDLLDEEKDEKGKKEKKVLTIREDIHSACYVEGLSDQEINNCEEALKLTSIGFKQRHTGRTLSNDRSSRSHCIFTIYLQSKTTRSGVEIVNTSKLIFVDLAGSERQARTGAKGNVLKEAGNINRSLVTLGVVIRGLIAKNTRKIDHIPYRDSKLTFLLKDSLGGNCKTWIIGTVSPSLSNNLETFSTLRFCQGSKMIQCSARRNQDYYGSTDEMKAEIERLKTENEDLKMKRGKYIECEELEKQKSRIRHLEYIVFAKMDQEHGLRHDITNMQLQVETKDVEIAQLKNKLETMEGIITSVKKQNQDLRRGRLGKTVEEEMKKELEKWQNLYNNHPLVNVLTQQNKLLSAQLESSQQNDEGIDDIKREKEELTDLTAVLSRQVREISQENERLEKVNAQLKTNATESIVNEYKKKIGTLNSQIVEYKCALDDRERRIEELQSDNEQLVEMIDGYETRLNAYSRKSLKEIKNEVLGGNSDSKQMDEC